jgi:hypothetical protein
MLGDTSSSRRGVRTASADAVAEGQSILAGMAFAAQQDKYRRPAGVRARIGGGMS